MLARLNLSLNNVRSCKGIFNSAHKQGLLFEKSKETDKFTASKIHESAIKASKTQSVNKF